MVDSSRTLPRLAAALTAAILLFLPRPARAEFPSLERAIELGRTRALAVQEAQAEIGVAQAQMAGARVAPLNNPFTELQIDRPVNAGIGGPQQQTLQVMTYTYFPLDIAGQRGKRIEEADKLIDWRKQGMVDARARVAGEVVSAYGEMIVSASRVAETVSGEQVAREEAKYFQGRFEAKDTTLYEKSVAEAEVARWVQSKAEAQLRLAQSRATLGQLMGVVAVEAPPVGGNISPPSLRGPWDDAQINRIVDKAPIIKGLAAERQYWDASIDRYSRERIPPLSLEVIAGRGAGNDVRVGGGAVVTFPITRRYQGEIRRAETGKTHAEQRLGLYRGIIQTRLRAARDAVGVTEKALAELNSAGIPALERAVTASVEGYKAGKIDLTRALLARKDLAIARSRRLDLLEASWRAYADLVILSGELP